MPTIERVVYGTIEAIRAEYSVCEMGQEWFDENGYKYVVHIVGDAQWDDEFMTGKTAARRNARGLAKELKVPYNFVA